MGLTSLRNWSVLLLASAALVGCNNTANKDRNVVAGPKAGDQLPGQAKAPPNFPDQYQKFPIAPPPNPGATNIPGATTNNPLNPGALTNKTPNPGQSPYLPVGGAVNNNKSFTPSNNPMDPVPSFPPMGQGNVSPMPYPATSSQPLSPITPPSGFGAGRTDVTPSSLPSQFQGGNPAIPQPAGFLPGRQ